MTPENLKQIRHNLGLSQIEMAQALGISRAGLQKREAGRAPIIRETALACAALLASLEPVGEDNGEAK